MLDPRRSLPLAVLFFLTVCPATLAQNLKRATIVSNRYDLVSVWLLLAVLLALSVVLNLTGKVEPFATSCENFLKQLIRIPYLLLYKFRRFASRKLRQEADCTPSDALAGLFFFAVVIGAGIANFRIVRMSLEAFLPNPEALSVLSAIFVMAKGGAGWLFHILARNARNSNAAKVACVAVLFLFVLSCSLDAGITIKRVSLIEVVNSGMPLTGDITTQFSENAALMAGINVLMSCLEFVFAVAAFHFAAKPISWLMFSPVLVPAFVVELGLGVIHKGDVAGAAATLLRAVLAAPKIIALGVINLVRRSVIAIKESSQRTTASLLTSLRERKIRKARLNGEVERAQAEVRFEAQELAATLNNLHKINSFMRETALSIATENVTKMAQVFPSAFASFIDQVAAETQTPNDVQLQSAADAIRTASVNPILTMANTQSKLDGLNSFHRAQQRFESGNGSRK